MKLHEDTQPKDEENAEKVDFRWRNLLKIGGLSAISAVVIVLIEAVVVTIWQPPATVVGWFNLFQRNRLLGLLDYAVLDAAVIALLGPMFIGVYYATSRENRALMTLAMPFTFAGIASYWASNTTFQMLFLSDQYAAATTDAQRLVYLASGQAIYSVSQYGMFYSMGFLLVAFAGVTAAVSMLRYHVFNKTIAYVGVAANLVMIGNYVSFVFVPTTSTLQQAFAPIGGILLFVWWILVGLKLFQLGHKPSQSLKTELVQERGGPAEVRLLLSESPNSEGEGEAGGDSVERSFEPSV
jgi:hypothetical protein